MASWSITQQKKEFFIDALHIFILVSLALSKPFYVLSQNAEFFVAHYAKPADIIILIIIFLFLFPTLLVFVQILAGMFGKRFRKGVHYLTVAGILTVIALTVLKRYEEFHGIILLTGAVIIGVVVTIAYIRFHPVRNFLTFLLPAIFLFPGLFLFNSPVTKIVFPAKDPSAVKVKIDNPVPVVMVIFDEFPVTSLMDERRMIDPIRYPNFSALAQDSYWFRNATTVADSTVDAVPAILSGIYPDQRNLPTANDYPNNIFTLLGGSYDLEVYETITWLCPVQLCRKRLTEFMERLRSLVADTAIVSLYVILPVDYTDSLPVVTQSWKDFAIDTADFRKNTKNETNAFFKEIDNFFKVAAKEVEKKDRGEVFRQFLRSIRASDRSSLYFSHSYLPHVPWSYLPSGRKYKLTGNKINGLKEEWWDDNELFVIEAFQQHLLQVGFVDKLLGELMDRLKSVGLYDRSLIVITADHGVSFRPNDSRRNVTKTNYQDIMPIPLFIKVPHQNTGIISDRNVETIDILPTIADVLDITMPWPVDGRSVFNISLPERDRKVIFPFLGPPDTKYRFVFEPDIIAKYNTLAQKISLFGDGTKPNRLYSIGSHSERLSRHISKVELMEEADVMTQLDQEKLFVNVDPMASFVPARITGRVLKSEDIGFPLDLAIAVNGTIQAVTKTFDDRGGKSKFSAIVPERAFQEGKNKVEVFVVSEGDGQLQLSRTKSWSKVTYTLTESGSRGEIIVSSDGKSVSVVPEALEGYVDAVDIKSDYVYVSGWAADAKNSELPDAIVIFVNGEFFYSGQTYEDRPDVVNTFGNKTLMWSGFNYAFFPRSIKNIANAEVRIFALSGRGVASEISRTRKRGSIVTYSLVESGSRGEIITSSTGASMPVIQNALEGYLDVVDVKSDYVHVSGWAVDVKNAQIPEVILIFVNGKFFFSGQSNTDRYDVVKAYRKSALQKSGFEYHFFVRINATDISEARVFAVSKKNVATELNYPKDYKWGKKP